MALTQEQITVFFHAQGAEQYGSEAVSQLQHALQCANLAERAGGSAELIAAALLHDLRHLLAPEPADPACDKDDLHQYVAIPFLRGVFSPAVIEPIRLHRDAKRYLCRVEKHYLAGLSSVSRHSLGVQGGTYSSSEAAAFIAGPMRLMQWPCAVGMIWPRILPRSRPTGRTMRVFWSWLFGSSAGASADPARALFQRTWPGLVR